MPNYVQGPPFPRGLYSGDKGYSFGALVAVAIAASPGGLVRNLDGSVTCTTSAAHKAVPGEVATIVGSTSVNGTRFDGNYFIKTAAFGSSALTLIPIDDIVLHQAPDTGGVGKISLIQMEAPGVPQAGTAFGLVREASSDFTPSVIYVDFLFDAVPGASTLGVEGAEIDHPQAYAPLAGSPFTLAAAALANHFVVNDQANFVRLNLLTRTNAVNGAGTIRA